MTSDPGSNRQALLGGAAKDERRAGWSPTNHLQGVKLSDSVYTFWMVTKAEPVSLSKRAYTEQVCLQTCREPFSQTT